MEQLRRQPSLPGASPIRNAAPKRDFVQLQTYITALRKFNRILVRWKTETKRRILLRFQQNTQSGGEGRPLVAPATKLPDAVSESRRRLALLRCLKGNRERVALRSCIEGMMFNRAAATTTRPAPAHTARTRE